MSSNKEIPAEHHVDRVGEWLPSDHRVHRDWLKKIASHVDQNAKELHPVLKEFMALIEGNTRIYMLFQSMFQEIPKKKPYRDEPGGHPQIRDYKHMIQVLNHILTTAPSWHDRTYRVGFVGLPFNALLDWPMGTPSGYAAFLDPEINAMIKKVLNAWGEFLQSPDSAYVLDDNDDSWFSDHGRSQLVQTAGLGKTSQAFDEMFICDSRAPRHGFKSWDDFFTRHFREGVRPVADPEDSKVIANACESKPYNIATNVKARDSFWVKGQPYSVQDMLAHDSLAERFVGGTIYQAFLSALSYHRWHAPVSGKVIKAYVVEGTYYSEPLFEGLGDPNAKHGIDIKNETVSQGYLTHVATRALIFFESDDPAIGTVAFVGVGMAEVSTCEITVKEGDKVKKGDEIGMFHFGGSTHCLLFKKGLKLTGFPDVPCEHNVPVRSKLAVVST